MTRDEIIAMAKEAGSVSATFWPDDFTGLMSVFERFAALVAAAEREACAKVCEDVSLQALTSWKLAYQPQDQGREMGADDCAAAIRQRGAA